MTRITTKTAALLVPLLTTVSALYFYLSQGLSLISLQILSAPWPINVIFLSLSALMCVVGCMKYELVNNTMRVIKHPIFTIFTSILSIITAMPLQISAYRSISINALIKLVLSSPLSRFLSGLSVLSMGINFIQRKVYLPIIRLVSNSYFILLMLSIAIGSTLPFQAAAYQNITLSQIPRLMIFTKLTLVALYTAITGVIFNLSDKYKNRIMARKITNNPSCEVEIGDNQSVMQACVNDSLQNNNVQLNQKIPLSESTDAVSNNPSFTSDIIKPSSVREEPDESTDKVEKTFYESFKSKSYELLQRHFPKKHRKQRIAMSIVAVCAIATAAYCTFSDNSVPLNITTGTVNSVTPTSYLSGFLPNSSAITSSALNTTVGSNTLVDQPITANSTISHVLSSVSSLKVKPEIDGFEGLQNYLDSSNLLTEISLHDKEKISSDAYEITRNLCKEMSPLNCHRATQIFAKIRGLGFSLPVYLPK